MKASELQNWIKNWIDEAGGDFDICFAFGSDDGIELFEECMLVIPPEGCKELDDTYRMLVPDPESKTVGEVNLKPIHLH